MKRAAVRHIGLGGPYAMCLAVHMAQGGMRWVYIHFQSTCFSPPFFRSSYRKGGAPARISPLGDV